MSFLRAGLSKCHWLGIHLLSSVKVEIQLEIFSLLRRKIQDKLVSTNLRYKLFKKTQYEKHKRKKSN